MGLLIIVTPYLIYFFIVKWLFNKYYKGENKKKRFIFFLLVVTLPLWDHIAGYIVYKYLCITKGGVKIYKTISDEKEQRDYWIDAPYLFTLYPSIGYGYGLRKGTYLTKDLKSHKEVYVNMCKNEKECNGLKKFLKEKYRNIIPYTMGGYPNSKIKYSRSNSPYIEDSLLKVTRIINNDKFEAGYFNYCKDEYNNLSKEDKNYKKSCTYANSLIKKYNLENVVKVLTKKYKVYEEESNFLPLFITEKIYILKNENNNEILAKYSSYTFWGGWYVYAVNPFHNSGVSCHKIFSDKFIELIIPNPFKETKK